MVENTTFKRTFGTESPVSLTEHQWFLADSRPTLLTADSGSAAVEKSLAEPDLKQAGDPDGAVARLAQNTSLLSTATVSKPESKLDLARRHVYLSSLSQSAPVPTSVGEWLEYNAVNPFVNGAVVEPCNAIASTVNKGLDGLGYQTRVGYMTPGAVAEVDMWSGAWWTQNITGGMGSLLPYVVAGKAMGATMFKSGSTLRVGATAATVAKNETIAQIAGAGVYDYMRLTRPGETREGNALGGASAFLLYEIGNTVSRRLPLGGLSKALAGTGVRAVTGAAGAVSHETVSSVVARRELPSQQQLYDVAVSGAAMNIALPATQRLVGLAVTKPADYINTRLGRGVPIDRYIQSRYGQTDSLTLKNLVYENPWARVQESSSENSALLRRNRVTLRGDKPGQDILGHELKHLSLGREARIEADFRTAASHLSKGDVERAWSQYRNTRRLQEVESRRAEILIELEQSTAPTVEAKAFARQVAERDFAHREPFYNELWSKEFIEFQNTKGKYRPEVDFGGVSAYKMKPDPVGVPQELKSKSKQNGDEAAGYKESEIQRQMATRIVKHLQDDGSMALFAGGSVRDELMGKKPKDYDVATSASPDQVIAILRRHGYTDIDVVGKAFGVVNVAVEGRHFEIATFRADGEYKDGRRPSSVTFVNSLEADAQRRDLTINAMYKDPLTGKIYDFHGGDKDILNGVIRAVGDPLKRFEEDRLRMMRIPRFAARYGFRVDPETSQALRKHASNIGDVAPERIAKELEGILTTDHPVVGLEIMMNSGLMKELLPEVYRMRGPKGRQDPTWHPEKTAWTHTKIVVNNLTGSSFERMMGALLHDVGKPDTQVIHPGGKITNHEHDAVGRAIAGNIANRLRLSNSQTRVITEMVDRHMQMHRVQELRRSRLIDLLEHPNIMDLIALQHADATGTFRADRLSKSQESFLLGKLEELKAQQALHVTPLVTGQTLLALDFRPGPQYRQILEAAKMAQREGEFATEDGGKRWVQDNFGETRQ